MSDKIPSIDELLSVAVANGASDLHLRAGSPPTLRVDGELRGFAGRALSEPEVELYLQAPLPARPPGRVQGGSRSRLCVRTVRWKPVPRQRLPPARSGQPGDPGAETAFGRLRLS